MHFKTVFPLVFGMNGGVVLRSGAGIPLDPDAVTRVDALRAAGATISDEQETLISDAFVIEKAAGRWDKIKRWYMPIWGVAAANAMCWKTGISGTFTVSGVTHSSGHVNSDGTTGCFLMDTSPVTSGTSVTTCGVFGLFTSAASLYLSNAYTYFGGRGTTSTNAIRCRGGVGFGTRYATAGIGTASTVFHGEDTQDQRGLVFLSRTSSTAQFFAIRDGSTYYRTDMTLAGSSANNTHPLAFLAYNSVGTPVSHLLPEVLWGLGGLTDGMTISDAEPFTLHLKDLWEALTGLALP